MNFVYGYTKKISLIANQRINTQLNLLADSNFILEKVKALYDEPFLIQIKDTTSNYDWFNDRIRAELFFGTAQYPNILPFPIELKKASILKLDIENLSGNNNDLELFFEGYRVFEDIKLSKKQYFGYPISLTIPALDIYTHTILINNDFDFLLQRLIGYKDNDYSLEIRIKFSCLSGTEIFSEFTNIDNIFGSVLRPNDLIHPIRVKRNSIITIDIKNKTNVNQNVYLLLDGIKIME
ncbi:MAG: hypothetical protein QW474_01115 [Candidatus Aenigmatarchaeota archaeon]